MNAPSKTFPVQRANELPAVAAQIPWLIQDLWTDQAVGILGGEPKCCKSFLALGIALAVASGTACLRRFPVRRSGPGSRSPCFPVRLSQYFTASFHETPSTGNRAGSSPLTLSLPPPPAEK